METAIYIYLLIASGFLYTLRGGCQWLPRVVLTWYAQDGQTVTKQQRIRQQQLATLLTPIISLPVQFYFDFSNYYWLEFMVLFYLATVLGWSSSLDMGTTKTQGRDTWYDFILDFVFGKYDDHNPWLWRYSRDFLGLMIRYSVFAPLFLVTAYEADQPLWYALIASLIMCIRVPLRYTFTNYVYKTFKGHDTTWIAEVLVGMALIDCIWRLSSW